MAALTNNFRTNEKAGDLIDQNVAANVQVWQGAMVMVTTSTGLISPAADTASCVFAGVAFEPVNNVGGSAGANSGRIQKTGTFVYDWTGTAATQATVGTVVYASDDHTVAASTSHSVAVGRVVGLVAGGQVRVRIDGYAF